MKGCENLTIRSESSEERADIRALLESAFGGSEEADLVDKLRDEGGVLVALLAALDTQIVGHVLFSRMWIDTSGGSIEAVALAPVAVLPEYQNRGIGARLIGHGLELLRKQGERIVIVVGHPAYYPRFGFSNEKARTLGSPFPAEAFMALELRAGALDGVVGNVRYAAAFGI